MIEINLVPDVKQELIRAERIRSLVVSLTILVGIAAVGIVVLLGLWVFGVQTARGILSDNTIKDQSSKLAAVEDLSSTLTIQNQLEVLPSLHEEKRIDSRIFDVLATINLPPPNDVSISKLVINSDANTIMIDAQTVGGYAALDAFKKTIAATQFEFARDGKKETKLLASNMSDGNRSYGEKSDGQKVVRFSLSFKYPEELFEPYLESPMIVGPGVTNATDSFVGIPKSLFLPKANDVKEGN